MRKTTINIFIINQLFSCGHHTIPTALQLTAELTEIIKLKNEIKERNSKKKSLNWRRRWGKMTMKCFTP